MDKRESCRQLWKDCFGDSELYMDYYFSEKWKNNIVLTKEESDEVVSMIHLNPYTLCWMGKSLKSYYIVGVATKKEYRGRGNMRELLEKSFSFLKENDIKFTYLMPANRKIYEPFGFQFIYEQERYRLHKIEKAHLIEELNSKTIDELSLKEWKKLLLFCEEKLQKEFDIYVKREKEYYENLQKEMRASLGTVRVFFKRNEIVGILSYGKENGIIEVTESLIHSSCTKEILDTLFLVEAESNAYFLESYFLDKDILENYAEQTERENVPIIMAKVLDEKESGESIWGGQKVYLNEIV